jgi:ABC-2 type transport system permease protein
MLILVPAITFELKNANIVVVDMDRSAESRSLINKLEGSTFFRITAQVFSEKEANDLMLKNKCDVILQIPSDFGKNLGLGIPVKIGVSVDAINASSAQLAWAYINGVIRDFDLKNSGNVQLVTPPIINVTGRNWYNEALNYKFYMLPGILAILITAIGFVLAGLNMVREKESGTIEQMNVTPVRKYQFIISKMVPFIIIGLVSMALGLFAGRLIFGIPFEGSVALMFICATIFLIAVLGLALFISTFSGTQQQFMFAAFFCMIIFILMSGVFTPFDSMPQWAKDFNLINPVAYLMKINRMIMLKGSSMYDISREIISLIIIAFAFTTLAVGRYRKRV